MQRTLVKNGAVVTLDAAIPDLASGDLLIENDRIAAVGANLNADGAQVIDAAGMVVMPGLVNSHIHTWELTLRGIGADWISARDYFANIHGNLAQRFEAEDNYVRTENRGQSPVSTADLVGHFVPQRPQFLDHLLLFSLQHLRREAGLRFILKLNGQAPIGLRRRLLFFGPPRGEVDDLRVVHGGDCAEGQAQGVSLCPASIRLLPARHACRGNRRWRTRCSTRSPTSIGRRWRFALPRSLLAHRSAAD